MSDSEIRWTREQNAVAIPRIPNAIPLFFNTDLTFVLIGEPPVSYNDPQKTTGTFNGVKLPVYDRERTICDCFKYRTKLDNEIFNKAVNAYVADEKKNLANLSKYAKEMGVYKKMMSVMEVLLNG